jgi:hypothetical protein
LRAKGWFAVVTAGLAGNSVTKSLPGGSAMGAGVQFQTLSPPDSTPTPPSAGWRPFRLSE